MTSAKAVKSSTTFRMECSVATTIRATPEKIWSLLTDAGRFPSWNSTVTRLEGPIALGRKLKIEVPAAPGRTFTPKVSELVEHERMVWSDGFAPMFKGVRTFSLSAKADGSTEFSMDEVFTGLMLPMIKGSLPDFAPLFEQYAADLKKAAEA